MGCGTRRKRAHLSRPNLARIVSKRKPPTTIGTEYRKFPVHLPPLPRVRESLFQLSRTTRHRYTHCTPPPRAPPFPSPCAVFLFPTVFSLFFPPLSLALSLPFPSVSKRHNFPRWTFRFDSSGNQDNDVDDLDDNDDDDEAEQRHFSSANAGITVSLFISRKRRYYLEPLLTHFGSIIDPFSPVALLGGTREKWE